MILFFFFFFKGRTCECECEWFSVCVGPVGSSPGGTPPFALCQVGYDCDYELENGKPIDG